MVLYKTKGVVWALIIAGLIWLIVLIAVFVHIIRRPEMSTVAKIFWIIVILSFPLLGLIIYLLIGRKQIED
jgi:hypothetical protein